VQEIRQPAELETGGRKVCVAIGMFDGVHLGHQQVIKQTISDAQQHNALSLAVTFDRHPNTIVAPGKAPPLIYSLPQKLHEIELLGMEGILVLEFTRAFSEKPGEEFVRWLANGLGKLSSVAVGSGFSFGYKRSGNVELLKRAGAAVGFQVHGLAAVSLGGRVVSSTRIRERIAEGDLDGASQMLGRTYSVSGRVVRGDQLGRQLGFPTANVDVPGLVMPPHGVYAVIAKSGGIAFRGVANIGVRPTVKKAESERRLEVHLPGFSGDLYGTVLEVLFAGFIRPEQRFTNLEELKKQIHRDIEAAEILFS